MRAGWLIGFLMTFVLSSPGADDAAIRHFHDKVKPLLSSRCISCHGPDKQKGSLRLDSRTAALKGGDNGPALVPGKPAESLLLRAVMHAAPDLEMPPKEKLTPTDIAVLERWIKDGALWPETIEAAEAPPKLPPGERLGNAWSDPRNPIARIFGGQRLDLWSLKPMVRPALPPVRAAAWTRNPIDHFILARLEQSALQPSPETDRRSLARRLYFDLVGMPPTPAEMDEFLRDRRPDAYERLVQHLLDSPRYGEHWARMWLDVVRYSDSNGFDWDEFRPKAWRFRDYAIRSFNADKPFDRFIREQLAGDELLEGPPKGDTERDYLIATSYLRLGPHDNSAPLFNEQARSRAELMADLVETTSSALLGLTMSCCRCHDHKFDPLSQADHFRLRAFFEPVKFADDLPLDLAPEQASIRAHNEALDKESKPLTEKRQALLDGVKKRIKNERLAKLTDEERDLLSKTNAPAELKKKIEPNDKEIQSSFATDEKKDHEELTKKIDALKRQKRQFTLGLLMTDTTEKVPTTKILFQGDYKDERDPVEPGFPSALDPNPALIRKGANPRTTGRRLTLAEWIVAPTNPFTARVLVNRVWQTHFGRGIVATPNDFGLAGAKPSHPELLDWLATEFIRQGWSLKKLHTVIVTSATYRQAASASEASPVQLASLRSSAAKRPLDVDAENVLLWRQNLRRLTAEQLRDSLLAVSGLLRERNGGPPVWPELPADILQANPAFLDDNAEKTKGWYPSPVAERNCRSLYLVQKKTVRVPFMETFDLPENSVSCARRNESIVAPQALSLLNGALAADAARALAQKVTHEAGSSPEARASRAFEHAYQRQPQSDELSTCVAFLKSRTLAELCRALLNANEFIYVD